MWKNWTNHLSPSYPQNKIFSQVEGILDNWVLFGHMLEKTYINGTVVELGLDIIGNMRYFYSILSTHTQTHTYTYTYTHTQTQVYRYKFSINPHNSCVGEHQLLPWWEMRKLRHRWDIGVSWDNLPMRRQLVKELWLSLRPSDGAQCS